MSWSTSRRGKASEVLVRLAVEPGTVVGADRLVEELWADEAAETRRNTLQVKVGMLRRALGPEVVVGRDGGYTLMLDAAQVDATAALRLTDEAAVRDREAGRHRPGCPGLGKGSRALPRRGPADRWRLLTGSTCIAPVSTRPGSPSSRSTTGRAWAWETSGTAIGELEGAVADHPFHESLWELLMTALYRAGRQADALSAYQRVRSRLGEELGLDPGPHLQRLERGILSQEAAIAGPSGTVGAEVRGRPRNNLPARSRPGCVGRQQEVETVLAALSAHRLVEVIGPGGVGKTALAVEVGRRVLTAPAAADEGVWLARLERPPVPPTSSTPSWPHLDASGEAALLERLRRRLAPPCPGQLRARLGARVGAGA